MIGTKLYKPLTEEAENTYTQCAMWCNETQRGRMEDKGEYYEVVEIVTTLEEAKQNKIDELKMLRDTEEVAPIEVSGNLYDYDGKARERINAAIIALDGGGSISWTLATNTNVTVTAEDLRNVVRAVAYRSNVLHIKYRNLRELVDGAETVEEVNAIVW